MFQLIAHCFTMLNYNDESTKVSGAPGEDYLGNTVRNSFENKTLNTCIPGHTKRKRIYTEVPHKK
jgi:hypothetical protein